MIKSNRIFIDTNILLISKLKSNPLNQLATEKFFNLFKTSFIFINNQVIREYLSTLTKQNIVKVAIPKEELINDINNFNTNFIVLNEDRLVLEKLLELFKNYQFGGKQIHDANIVATMMANGIRDLFTHNVSDFIKYREIINIIPLI